MTKRISKTILESISLPQYEDALQSYTSSHKRELVLLSRIEAEIIRIRSKYADELRYCAEKKKSTFEVIQTYCLEKKEILFCKRRSYKTPYGTIGFRLGTPKLKTMRGHTWETVLQQLKEKLPAYIRNTEEPAKDMLLADRYKEHVAACLQELGLQIVQDEIFFFDMKKTEATIA